VQSRPVRWRFRGCREHAAVACGRLFRTEDTLIRGQTFQYEVPGNYLRPIGRVRHLSKTNFAKALERVPFTDTRSVGDLQGPSYVYAILMDERIRRGDWSRLAHGKRQEDARGVVPGARDCCARVTRPTVQAEEIGCAKRIRPVCAWLSGSGRIRRTSSTWRQCTRTIVSQRNRRGTSTSACR
jgi:hypothetical protein